MATVLGMIKTRNHVAVTLAIIIVIQVDINVICSTIIWCMDHSAVCNIRELDAIPIRWQIRTYTFHLLSSCTREFPSSVSVPSITHFILLLVLSFVRVSVRWYDANTFLLYSKSFDNNRCRKSSDVSSSEKRTERIVRRRVLRERNRCDFEAMGNSRR